MSEGRFAGIDWASEEHAVCVVDEHARMVEGRRYRHEERGIKALCGRLVGLGVELVAIERPDGLLIERLLDAGLSVIAVHPNQVVASRPRFTAAGGKSDNFDAFVLAELARTDSHRFRVLKPDSDRTKALRAMCRGREDLVRARQALGRQLCAQLECFWPGATKVFCEIDSPIALAFLERYPSPVDARYLGEQRLAAFLDRHGYSGGREPRELLARLRAAAHGRAGELEVNARRQIVLALVAALKPLGERIEQLRLEIRQAVLDHPDGDTFRSLFIDDRTVLCPATILAEMGDRRERYPSYRELAADAGQAPVAVESGKSKRARFRWACDHRLRNAINTLADSSRHHNPWAKDIYARARQRGCTHQHATRILGRAWCQIIWRIWHDHDTYAPGKHTALQRLVTTTGAPEHQPTHPRMKTRHSAQRQATAPGG
jgi:transposase